MEKPRQAEGRKAPMVARNVRFIVVRVIVWVRIAVETQTQKEA
jgi:hypothetical protein